MAKWNRIGVAAAFGAVEEGAPGKVGWTWEIRRPGFEARHVRVEVEVSAPSRPTDFPAEARNAIRSRGATAVDAFLARDEPPARIIISTLGVRDADLMRPVP
jgi:hypothetical protein